MSSAARPAKRGAQYGSISPDAATSLVMFSAEISRPASWRMRVAKVAHISSCCSLLSKMAAILFSKHSYLFGNCLNAGVGSTKRRKKKGSTEEKGLTGKGKEGKKQIESVS